MDSLYLFKEIKKLKSKSLGIYDKFLNENNEEIKQELSKELDRYDIDEDELKKKHLEKFEEEYREKCLKLFKDYGGRKYKVEYRNGDIKYFNHRREFFNDDFLSAAQLRKISDISCEEIPAIDKVKDYIHYFYNEDFTIKEFLKVPRSKDQSIVKKIYRRNFRYEDFGHISFLEFNINESYSIEYIKDDKISMYAYIGSKFVPIKILSPEDGRKVKDIINRLRKDKYINIDEILNKFNI